MKIKKVLSAVLAVSIIASVSVGCTQKQEPKNKETNEKKQDQGGGQKSNEQSMGNEVWHIVL